MECFCDSASHVTDIIQFVKANVLIVSVVELIQCQEIEIGPRLVLYQTRPECCTDANRRRRLLP